MFSISLTHLCLAENDFIHTNLYVAIFLMLFSGDCTYVRSDEGYLCMSRIDKMWTDRKCVIILCYVIEEIIWTFNTGSHYPITCHKTQVITETCLICCDF